MTPDLSTDGTTIIATYSNRQDAEVARAQLADHDITALITADDVHPPLQMTEGVTLRVLDHEVEQARDILDVEAKPVPAGDDADMRSGDDADAADLTFSSDGLVQATAWTYVALFLLMIAVILTGLWITSAV